MARTDSLNAGELTDTAFYILLSLINDKHGYLIMSEIETITNNKVSIGPASLYSTLKKLSNANLIEQLPNKNENKKTYIATRKGIALLEKEVERRKQMVEHAERILSKERRER